MGFVGQGVCEFYHAREARANVSRIPCDDVGVSIVGVCVLWLWGLVVCADLDGCKACDQVGAFGKVLEYC